MAKRVAKENIVKELMNISESEGAMILTTEGSVIGAELKNDYNKSQLITAFSELMDIINKIMSKENLDEPDQVFAIGEKKKILIYQIKDKGLYVIVFGSENMNTGFAKIAIEKTLPLLKEIRK
ncbi:MAG: roadblock/LC7 domain-containing protein [Candidatus Aminicenantaceae bacterium]